MLAILWLVKHQLRKVPAKVLQAIEVQVLAVLIREKNVERTARWQFYQHQPYIWLLFPSAQSKQKIFLTILLNLEKIMVLQ